MKGKVLVTVSDYSHFCAEAKKLLEENGLEVLETMIDDSFISGGQKKAVMQDVVAVITGTDIWNENIFKVTPNLKVISRFGVGVDNIDLEKAKEYGIKVTNAKGMNANAVAELTIGLIFGVLRNIPGLSNSLHEGNWTHFMGRDIQDKKVGLLGFGDIAQRVAKFLTVFDTDVYAYDKSPNITKANEYNVKITSMEDILRKCNIVSLHLPSMKETYHIMGYNEFKMMMDGSYFINTARGALVDENALYYFLKKGKLAGAAVDVYDVEPTPETNPLLELDNLICTPHTAAETYETYNKVSLLTAHAIIDVLNNRTPENLLNG